ncbi:MAG TPA: ABC transporter ATP-binding protein, partial [Candidatus Eisenbacteria bacterium]|nr:ABC transporter ATP-binding protein [Candidatus Eisenbacteria bacterium]
MIRARGLHKRYGRVTALQGLDMEVGTGETFALVGPNGAGKTTTLQILLGLVHPDAGTVEIGPARLSPDDRRARAALGYVPQRVVFPGGRTVHEVLGFFADLRGLGAGAVTRALERVGLTALADRRARELSGGYTQRLSLAQALLGDPGLLVLDEPTASLDPQATWEFRSLLERLSAEGKTILLCSHLLAEVERVADRVLILVDGRCAALQRMSDLRGRQLAMTRLVLEPLDLARAHAVLVARGLEVSPRGRLLAVDAANGHALGALEALRSAGVGLRRFDVERPSLEDIFLDVVRRERGATPAVSAPAAGMPPPAAP